MNVDCLSVVIIFIMMSAMGSGGETIDEQDGILQNYLLRNYNRNVRPVEDRRISHHIRCQLFLISLDDFDMKKQTVKCRMFLELQWKDEFLSWEPSTFRNTTRMNMDAGLLWIPDLIVGNEDGPFTFLNYSMMGKAVIQNDGLVTVWPYLFIEVGCQVAITDYPFDEQTFHIRISSWGLTTKDLIMDLKAYEMTYSYYQESGEWEITRYYAQKWNRTIGPDLYSRVAYFLTVRRKSLYFILNVIGPLVVTSLLNTMCFILPVESAQRVTLSVSIFLSLAIFLTIITESLPRTSDGVSVTVIYLSLQVLGSFLTIAMNVIILNIYHKNESKKKSIFLQSMLQISNNINLMGWKNDSTVDAKDSDGPRTANKADRNSNGNAVMVNDGANPEERQGSETCPSTSPNTLQISRQTSRLSTASMRRSVCENQSKTDENESDAKRKVPKIRSRSVKDEETVWTTRANYLNTCSFWFSVLWNIGLILVLVIIPRV